MYKERINYHESVEDEHKKNLEQQVDVILKMEEERLVLLKEHKQATESIEKFQKENIDLNQRNEGLNAQISTFEEELQKLRDEVKEGQEQAEKEKASLSAQIQAQKAKRPAVGGIRSVQSQNSAKKNALKFNKPAADLTSSQSKGQDGVMGGLKTAS